MEYKNRADHAIESLTAACDIEYIIMGDLRQLLSEPPTQHTRRSLLVLLNRLLLSLPQAMRLSSEDCFMNVVLEKRPNWHRKIEMLHRDNVRCYIALCELRDRIENEVKLDEISEELDCQLREWMVRYSQTRSRENQLLQEALTMDFGGEA